MDAETKTLFDEQAKTWEEFKSKNDELVKQVDKLKTDAVTKDEQKKLNEAMDAIGDKIAEARGAYLGHWHKAVDHRRLSQDADMPSAPEDLLALRDALATLPARERAVLAAEFGFEGRSGAPTMRDESDAATEQIRAMAMRKLRAALAG